MSSRESNKLRQRSVNEETTTRNLSFEDTTDVSSDENEDQLSKNNLIARCKKKKMNKSFQETPLFTAGHELLVVETRDGVPVVELPSSLKEDELKCDRYFLLESELKPEDRQHLLAATSVFKSKLVTRLISSADDMSYKDMILLASECYNILGELGDDYASFQNEVTKLINQHRKVESGAKDKEKLNEWDIKARYNHQVQVLSELRQKLSSAQKELLGAETKVDSLMFKKEQLTGAINMLTEKLSEVEDRVNILTAERVQVQEAYSGTEVELEKLDAEMMEASVLLKAYNCAKEDFERLSNHLLQFVKN
ncbi:hypothetical protein POM88_034681 [Heracleum sosnowskyi]|uniref:Uncharacterized protein n=1 Tax=Heracleum sosnowskyi TaxID=360622 RepID=A0AAD8HK17_9APIA|nr:hypothetical protein POM88_034681 [Heracleum sosnowskyi]